MTRGATDTTRRDAAPVGRGETVLLAEDDPLVRDLAIQMLEGASYRVIAATDGAEADAIIRNGATTFDVVILDVVMPHRNGRQVYETLRAARPGVPAIFCSGDAGELGDLAELTGVAILAKPYRRAELLAAVRDAIDAAR
jgi:two-component system, cell cycle sensor histidine kinase and response regulator CckA